MKAYPIAKVYRLIEPGPVVLLTTSGRTHPNVMTMSWTIMMEFEPALIGCVVSPADYSYRHLLRTRECVVSIPGADLATKVVDIGNCSGKDVDKFKKFRLTPLPAAKVAAPLVAECLSNLECRVVDTTLVRKYAFFVLEVKNAWTNPQRKERRTLHSSGDGLFALDGKALNLKRRMTKWN